MDIMVGFRELVNGSRSNRDSWGRGQLGTGTVGDGTVGDGTVGDGTIGDGDDLIRFSHGYGISNSAISFSPRATARLIADCPTPKSFPTAVPSMPNFLTAR
jgi:hypothetical protein